MDIKQEPSRPAPFSRWLHKKSGHHYEVFSVALLEATLVWHVVYTRADLGGNLWIRPLDEFLDGRFEEIK